MERLAIRQRDAGRSLLNLPGLAWKSLSRAVRAGSEIAKHLFAFNVKILLAVDAGCSRLLAVSQSETFWRICPVTRLTVQLEWIMYADGHQCHFLERSLS